MSEGFCKVECRPLGRIYYNAENGYTVASFLTEEELPKEVRDSEERPGSFRATGEELPAEDGLTVELCGRWKKTNYGMQLDVKSFHIRMPASVDGIRKYLSSGLIKGIGPVTAERIVEEFGQETFHVIENEPERLLTIRGITETKLSEILSGYRQSMSIRELMTYLSPMGATPRMVTLIQERFGEAAVSIVKSDPYRLCEVKGFGFLTVDPIATKSRSFRADAPGRIKAAIRYVLSEAEGDGHLFLHAAEIVEQVSLLLNRKDQEEIVSDDAIKKAGNDMVYKDKELVAGGAGSVYTKKAYEAEAEAAYALARLARFQPGPVNIDAYLKQAEKKTGVTADEKQREAVRTVFQNGVSIITGGPGRGKTTVIRLIVEVQEAIRRDAMILLCAPTGRARRKMYESTGYPAMTIHKALQMTGEPGEETWKRAGMLEDDLVVADEISMLDMYLANHLFRSIKAGARLVLVGDKDQIQSVGPGAVFRELIASGAIPVVTLDTCFRQGEHSLISSNADRINQGDTHLKQDDSFKIYIVPDDGAAADKICEVYRSEWLAHGRNSDEIQVLSPLKKDTLAGADALNGVLREIANPVSPDKPQVKHGGLTFQVGDKVMQLKNMDDVANGDTGVVTRIERDGGKCSMEVDFGDGRSIVYKSDDVWPLTHAYAMTVHKAQGSEYDTVILPMLPCFRRMLKRNIFYTAVTRAKKKVILVGSWKAIYMAIRINDTKKRNTLLGARVREAFQRAEKYRNAA
ncbi:MAG: ATP-dependent RecD-like DNA helicase [Lachnospiraceae bacterium]|nr:ATP-dependent RecD-like DNA helicase [Lachnospiraceae bacterium]